MIREPQTPEGSLLATAAMYRAEAEALATEVARLRATIESYTSEIADLRSAARDMDAARARLVGAPS